MANASLCRLRRTALRCGFPSRRGLKDAGGKAPIAQTLDRDLGLVARYLANPRATGDAAVNLETQCLRGCLRIGRNNNIDEIGHWIAPSRKLTPNSGASLTSDCMQSSCARSRIGVIFRDIGMKTPYESGYRSAKSKPVGPKPLEGDSSKN